jgi:transposase
MAAPYSLDLRQKILHAHERGIGSQRLLAELFGVSLSFVERLLRRYRRTGGCAPKRRAGPSPKRLLDEAAQEHLRQLVLAQPDATLAELGERLHAATGVQVSVPTLCRILYQLGLRRKKRRSTPPNATPNKSARHASPSKTSSPDARSSGLSSSTNRGLTSP